MRNIVRTSDRVIFQFGGWIRGGIFIQSLLLNFQFCFFHLVFTVRPTLIWQGQKLLIRRSQVLLLAFTALLKKIKRSKQKERQCPIITPSSSSIFASQISMGHSTRFTHLHRYLHKKTEFRGGHCGTTVWNPDKPMKYHQPTSLNQKKSVFYQPCRRC